MQGLPAFVNLFILSALGRSLSKSFAERSSWEGNNFPLVASADKWKRGLSQQEPPVKYLGTRYGNIAVKN